MDKFPLLWGKTPVGEVTAQILGEETLFTARCTAPGEGLWSIWLVGERGEIRLGTPEKQGGTLSLRRRFSHRLTGTAGRLIRGELRRAAQAASRWTAVKAPESLFRDDTLRRCLQEHTGVLIREGEVRSVAIPYAPDRPFPLPALFCFASLRRIGERRYLVFSFDSHERPII